MKFKNWKKIRFLDDAEWHDLDNKAAKMLVMLWLIARDNKGVLPNVKQISFLLRCSCTETQKILKKLSNWLIFDDVEDNNQQENIFLIEEELYKKENGNYIEENPSNLNVSKPLDVPNQVWEDFLNLRKAKKAPLTFTALKRIENEAKRAQMPLVDVLTICCERGWQGFCAEWMKNIQPKVKQDAVRESNREIAEKWLSSQNL